MSAPASQPQTQQRTNDTPQQRQPSALESAIAKTNQQIRSRSQKLTDRLPDIEELLPPYLKGQGSRLVKRAILTLARKPDMLAIPEQDLVRCVMEAAEVGLAIDGKNGYIVKYKQAYQFQADYKALVVSLRRAKILDDCYADVVCESDDFRARREDGKSYLRHEYDLSAGPRGEVIGAYAVIILPGGAWRYEVMTRQQLDGIQKRAPSKNGPWSTDQAEMQKKTVIRRLLKLYVDDPAAVQALAEPWEGEELENPTVEAVREKLADLPRRYTFVPAASVVEEEFDPPQKEFAKHEPAPEQPAPVMDDYAVMLANMKQHIAEVDPSGLAGMLELVKEHRANGDLRDEDYAALVKQIETRQAAPGKHKRGQQ